MSKALQNKERELAELIIAAVEAAQRAGELPKEEIPKFTLEVPREKQYGDYATNVAMVLASQADMPPREVASKIIAHLDPKEGGIKNVVVGGPGFINFTLNPAWVYDVLREIIRERDSFGQSDLGNGKKIQVEYVSANPTGPMHMGNARGAAVGDTMANILEALGYQVEREFYVNDAGNQIDIFARSLDARYLQLLGRDVEFPEDGYPGGYITEIMRELVNESLVKYLELDEEERRAKLTAYALHKMIDGMRKDLKDFGVEFNLWFSERSLFETGEVTETISYLKEHGLTYEKDGALWFAASKVDPELKDEVLIRSNGIPTYLATDIAYHRNKFNRGFERVINVWGADHHGHIARMKASLQALGIDPDKLDIIIIQLVRLFRNGEPVRLSKRAGEMVTLRELIDEIGAEAARFFFLMRDSDSHFDFDLSLAVEKSKDNPLYYVQYAHARICSILRTYDEQCGEQVVQPEEADLSLLSCEDELELIRKMADFPGVVRLAGENLEPHRIVGYVHELASLFHSYYNKERVICEDSELTQARICLVIAIREVIHNALNLIGVSAPEAM